MTSSKIENTNDCPAKVPVDAATTPFLRVIVDGVGVILVVSTKN